MLGDNDTVEHKSHQPHFTPPRFNWHQDNLYKQFKSFKRVVEFKFQGQYKKCSNGIKCGSILNWLWVEAYPMYDNLSISEDDGKDSSKLLDAGVCEGTVHSEEISKQYLELVKTVKQVDAIHQCSKSKHKGRGHGGHRSHSRSQSRRPGGGCSNCGSSHPPKKCKARDKECFHCHKKGHFSQFCHSKQCEKFSWIKREKLISKQ